MQFSPGDRHHDADVPESEQPMAASGRRLGAEIQASVVQGSRQARFRLGIGLASAVRCRPRSAPRGFALDGDEDTRSIAFFTRRGRYARCTDNSHWRDPKRRPFHTRSVSRRTASILVWARCGAAGPRCPCGGPISGSRHSPGGRRHGPRDLERRRTAANHSGHRGHPLDHTCSLG